MHCISEKDIPGIEIFTFDLGKPLSQSYVPHIDTVFDCEKIGNETIFMVL
jgi:hypothetical protein